MGQDFITKAEYLELSKEERHQFINNRFQPVINDINNKMDKHTTTIALIDQSQKMMMEEFKEHKKETKE